MSHQNTRGGFSGRSPRPDDRYSRRNRHVGASKPFANEDIMPQGRGKHSDHISLGSGSKHVKDKPTSTPVYRPKIPSPDVILNSLEAVGSNMKQPDFSGKVKVGHMLETPPTAKADTEDQASQEKGASKLSGFGDSAHSVQQAADKPFDICPPKRDTLMLKPSLLVMNRQKRNDINLFNEGRCPDVLRPGMVLLKNYLSISDQVNIVKTCRDLGLGPGGFYQPGYRGGASLYLKMMCLGKNWDPETSMYADIRPIDGAKPPTIPAEFHQLVVKAIQDSRALIGKKYGGKNIEAELPWMSPDICIANFYLATGKLGLHQDKDESKESIDEGLPVVSFSVGDSAEFLYGDLRDVDTAKKVILESGDVLIFGGKSRRIFHGVAKIIPETAPKSLQAETNIRCGRLNLTFRQY